MRHGLFCDPLDLVKAVALGRGRARDPAPVLDAIRRRGGDIIGHPHGAHINPLIDKHFRRDIKIHIITGIIAIQKQDAPSAVRRSGRGHDDVGRGRGKHAAAGRRITKTRPHKAMKHGFMPRSAPDQERDLGIRQIGSNNGIDAGQPGHPAIIGQHQAIDHLLHYLAGIVENFLGNTGHGTPPESLSSPAQ